MDPRSSSVARTHFHITNHSSFKPPTYPFLLFPLPYLRPTSIFVFTTPDLPTILSTGSRDQRLFPGVRFVILQSHPISAPPPAWAALTPTLPSRVANKPPLPGHLNSNLPSQFSSAGRLFFSPYDHLFDLQFQQHSRPSALKPRLHNIASICVARRNSLSVSPRGAARSPLTRFPPVPRT
ncbi:hypothetical protein BGZ63DRAFT_121473 [Mariannaea sp. PMI_226]|nr:hypothetical protein BGZ63DRAFT_121473 [Mariannaea sp. PMI_226]